MTMDAGRSDRARAIAEKVEAFVRQTVIPYEQDPRLDHHGAPTDDLVMEMREHARAAGVLTPHILGDGEHLNQRETAIVLIKSGLSPLGPLACNTMAPDEGNMYLLGKEGSPELKEWFLKPMVEGRVRPRSEEHTSELQSLMRISYAVFCLKKKTKACCTRSRE